MSSFQGQPPVGGDPGQQPSEEEMRAAYEAELKRIRVQDVLVQTVVSLINLGGRKAGLAPGTEDERDLEQVRLAVEGTRALLPYVEPELGQEAAQVRQALSQLQMAYAQGAGQQPDAPAPAPDDGTGQAVPGPEPRDDAPDPGQPGPAQQSGRLWVPGQ